jgi:hypothetical protein
MVIALGIAAIPLKPGPGRDQQRPIYRRLVPST